MARGLRSTHRRERRLPDSRGFTLIELVVTLALVAIVALAVMPFSELMVQRQIRTALDAYKEASDSGSIEKEADASGFPPSLSILVAGVKNAKDPNAGLLMFLRRVPRDPFFTGDVATQPEDTWDVRAYGSVEGGPQAGRDVFDVTSRSERTGLNGIPYKDW